MVATAVSIFVAPLTWSLSYKARNEVLAGEDEFRTDWLTDESEQSPDDFAADSWSWAEESEEDQEFSDGDPEWDGHAGQLVDCYTVLGVSPDASVEAIKAAYREKVLQYHPDRVATLGPKLRELAESETKKLNAAYHEALRKH